MTPPSSPDRRSTSTGLDLPAISARVEQRLTAGRWGDRCLAEPHSEASDGPVEAAAEVATFALGLSGRRRLARRQGRVSRLIVHFALAASVALTGVATACDILDDVPGSSAVAVDSLPAAPGADAGISAPVRADMARYQDLVLLDPGVAGADWALLASLADLRGGQAAPVLVDRRDAGLGAAGSVVTLPARAVPLVTRDGPSQFLDPVAEARPSDARFDGDAAALKTQLLERWRSDERYAAALRAIDGQPTVLDAAYNAAAAAEAGGTHTYVGGVVLRVDPDNPVLEVADRALVESNTPLRADDVVYVALRANERAIYEPGQTVTLRDVVVERHQSDVEGQGPQTFHLVNAALQGARVEPTGKIDLQSALQRRLQRTDADLAVQAQELSADPGAAPQATPTPAPGRTTVVRQYYGPSFIDDYLMWRWLTQRDYYRGPASTIGPPPSAPSRPSGDYYYVPPSAPTARDAPAASQTTSRSQALQSARNAVSGQAAGTGGGTAATEKAAAQTSARASAATNKAASLAGGVSSASVGKSVSSVASGSSSAARSAGSVSSSTSASSSRSTGVTSSGSRGFGGSGSTSSSAS